MNAVLGVDIGGTDVKLGILSSDTKILERGKISTKAAEGPGAVAVRVKEWLDENNRGYPEVSMAGIGCAGLVSKAGGILHSSPNLPGWDDIPLAGIFSNKLSMPVVVDNDANVAAYGEFIRGAGMGCDHFICLTMGTGFGGGIIIEGKLLRGSSGFAGEIGHTTVQVDGPLCGCGKRGCLEALVRASSIVDRARSMLDSGHESLLSGLRSFTVKDIDIAASKKDEVSIRVFAETGRFLGIGLANLVHLFNPEVIAIGGGVAAAGDFILNPAREALRSHLMDDILAEVRIVPATLGNTAAFIGAALLALDSNRGGH